MDVKGQPTTERKRVTCRRDEKKDSMSEQFCGVEEKEQKERGVWMRMKMKMKMEQMKGNLPALRCCVRSSLLGLQDGSRK